MIKKPKKIDKYKDTPSEKNSGIKEKMNTLKYKVSELKSSSFFDEVIETEQMLYFFEHHAQKLEKEKLLLGIELERLQEIVKLETKQRKTLVKQIDITRVEGCNKYKTLSQNLDAKEREYINLQEEYDKIIAKLQKLENEYKNHKEKSNSLQENNSKQIEYLKQELSKATEENNALNDLNKNLNTQIEQERFNSQERLDKLNEEARSKEDILKQEHQKQLEDMRNAFEKDKTDLLVQMDKHWTEKFVSSTKAKDIELQDLISKRNNELNLAQEENESLKTKMFELKNTYNELSDSYEILQCDLSVTKEKLAKLNDQREKELRELSLEKEIIQQNLKDQAEERLENELDALRNAYDDEIAGYKQCFSQLEDKLNVTIKEKDTLEANYTQLQYDYDNLKREFEDSINAYEADIEHYIQQIEKYKKTVVNPRDNEAILKAERAAHELKLRQLNKKIEELETEYEYLSEEKDRFEELANQRLIELKKERERTNEVPEEDNKIESEQQILTLKTEIDNYQYMLKQEKKTHATFLQKIKNLEDELENYRTTNTELTKTLENNKYEFNLMESEIKSLKNLQATFAKENSEYKNNIAMLTDQIKELERSNANEKKQKENAKKNAEEAQLELDNKSKELLENLKALDELQIQYYNAFNNCESLNFDISNRKSKKEKKFEEEDIE